MTDLLFSDDQLAALGRSPWLVVPEALEARRFEEAEQVVAGLEAGCRGQLDRYTGWLSSIFEFFAQEWGRDGEIVAIRATRAFFATSPDVAAVDADDPAPAAAAIVAAATSQGSGAARDLFEELVARWRRSIDLHRDWISALLSAVYRREGPDRLEAVLRYCGDRGLVAAIEQHVQRSPQDRLVDFVRLLHGHFAELTLSEDSQKFTITQDLCGTCSRQILDGRFGPPLNLAVVAERHAVTWGRGNTTIYRSHVPIWHVEMAREQLGVPWPVNQCPDGLDAGVCRILLYKDPYDPAAEAQIPRPAQGSRDA
jgi:hypothetical protein